MKDWKKLSLTKNFADLCSIGRKWIKYSNNNTVESHKHNVEQKKPDEKNTTVLFYIYQVPKLDYMSGMQEVFTTEVEIMVKLYLGGRRSRTF